MGTLVQCVQIRVVTACTCTSCTDVGTYVQYVCTDESSHSMYMYVHHVQMWVLTYLYNSMDMHMYRTCMYVGRKTM